MRLSFLLCHLSLVPYRDPDRLHAPAAHTEVRAGVSMSVMRAAMCRHEHASHATEPRLREFRGGAQPPLTRVPPPAPPCIPLLGYLYCSGKLPRHLSSTTPVSSPVWRPFGPIHGQAGMCSSTCGMVRPTAGLAFASPSSRAEPRLLERGEVGSRGGGVGARR